MNATSRRSASVAWAVVVAAVLAVGTVFGQWQFVITVALTKGLVALGLVLLMRAGLVSFGQGLFYCAGAYVVGMAMNYWNVRELAILLPAACLVTALLAALLGFLLSNYRDIFFAMLSLALSMILYGLLVRNPLLGGSDGFNVKSPTLLWGAFGSEVSRTTLFVLTLVLAAVALALVRRYLRSASGRLGPAIKDNEVRVEYLGTSARRNIHLNYILAGALAGLGGGLSAFSVGHIDPEMAFWTTSGEFVFIAVLGGTANAYAPFAGALILEVIRSLAYQYAPNTWQIVLGGILLALIVFLPGGLASMAARWQAQRASRAVAVGEAAEGPQ